MKKLALAAFVFGLVGMLALAGTARAADKNDATGTWKVTAKFGKKDVESTWKLESKDGKLTGTVTMNKGEVKIEDGKIKDGEFSFSVTREIKENKVTSKYAGKVTGDTIKGTATTSFNDKEFKSDFDGKREK
ncbi:hypothetical protein GobsT_03840 [Gemmata obscuriglobus]|uniref:TIGR03066 family protein n=1 Tax=Gemmata obscuriglobus TaxID=114 RepID=A0A2Z3H9A8_9BACT|nr:hypothetical protein [Gemmata obscuriglobus]AWM41022.1 hypothetical protein C1280_31245 [Gemmata obscuriglobus]QEG25657.1 hypothetical protein GobsT_03840 [Gemmata obscuriglobus]VTR99241.1 Uncharacterized protein OS=Singulisphaera acidiphila (strain ATCC BAA-1392 / DSM 18658 / VKM B-2454 / MOB10) GN=Sinac_2505 PE=4 SV=1 [Gemmata obscuriglobus UQM 2246]